jgi:hypothetical protein
MALRPELAEIDRLAADARATAEATLNGMTVAQLEWTPDKSRWSAAMIADHLVRTTEAIREKVEVALASAPPANGENLPAFGRFERMFIGAMSPGTKMRLPVPPMFEPKPPADPQAAVAAFFATHEGFVRLIHLADEKQIAEIKITSPASSLAKFRLLPYLHALAQHERYHLEQVKALIEEPGFPR